MAKSRRERVATAVKKIRAFYALGRKIPPKQRHKDAYNHGVIRREAERRGVNEDTVRKARQFADPAEGYTPQELEELCGVVERVQPEQDDGLAIFGKTHVIRLLSVRPRRKRTGLQKQAIEGGWSTAELEAEIARRFGTRREGGRRRRVPAAPADLLVQLEGMCETWGRWQAAVAREPEDGAAARASVRDLPADVRTRLVDVGRRLGRLHRAVVEALAAAQPGREVRQAFRPAQEVSPEKGPAGRRE